MFVTINNDGIKINVECKELIDIERCNEEFIWNPSNCECECDELCDIGEYLHYEICKCRKRLNDKLVEECSENFDENEMIYNVVLNDYKMCAVLVQYTFN